MASAAGAISVGKASARGRPSVPRRGPLARDGLLQPRLIAVPPQGGAVGGASLPRTGPSSRRA
jgi:hypothetical protein